jgi:hypothetical protein
MSCESGHTTFAEELMARHIRSIGCPALADAVIEVDLYTCHADINKTYRSSNAKQTVSSAIEAVEDRLWRAKDYVRYRDL